jgi:urease accessory protein
LSSPPESHHRESDGGEANAAPLAASALLNLIWLASPALPVGGFSYSEGFEAAVESGRVGNEAEAAEWLRDQLHLSLARSEMAVIASGYAAWRRDDAAAVTALNRWVRCTREASETLQQTEQMGRSLCAWLAQRGVDPQRHALLAALRPAPTWPVAFALAALHSGAPLRESLLAFAFGWSENLVQAAVKAMPLGQSAGQRILAALAAESPAAVDHAMRLGEDDRQAYAPMLAILASQHEVQYSRLFRS